MMKTKLAYSALLGIFLGAIAFMPASFAYAPEPDVMEIKGYSPEIINTTQVQRNRQEWRKPPAPPMTPREQFFHNIYYNNWIGGVDPFGSQVIRQHQ
ncbi:MAG: hypothetical protein KTR14_07305 [Vampirovibrio sp.]|nr:hypothetical protein [Vampirovibrio sp.]